MTKYSLRIQVKDGELEEILNRLNAAQREIFQCYTDLGELGALVIEKKKIPPKNNNLRRQGCYESIDSQTSVTRYPD